MDIKPYKQKFDYSYCLGAFPTFELLLKKPEAAREVLVHSSFTDREKLEKLCMERKIPIKTDDKAISRLSDKENVYVIGIYEKYQGKLAKDSNHLMLVNPSNMGNAGTIIRTAAAFDIKNIAIISPGIDIHNPKVVRGSMGAVFGINIEYFESFSKYRKEHGAQNCYSFMLDDRAETLVPGSVLGKEPYTLIFGNEATGLPADYAELAKPLIIPQSESVDSLNLTIAAGIGMYMFKNTLKKS